MPYTGGPLNELNGKMGISAPQNSVPVMKLIRMHRPKSRDELVELIAYHFENECECGIRSKGTIRDFGRNLYESQITYWGEYRCSLQECMQWEYDLFIVQSLKGSVMEKKAVRLLAAALPFCAVVEAPGFVDEELRIDLLVQSGDEEKCGIQVKPASFTKMRAGVISFNRSANAKWNRPVYYLFYDDRGEFVNIGDVVEAIKRI